MQWCSCLLWRNGIGQELFLQLPRYSVFNSTCRFMRNDKSVPARRAPWSKGRSIKQRIDSVSFGRLNTGADAPSEISISTFRISKPFIFTILFCSSSIVGATIWQYENMKKRAHSAIRSTRIWSSQITKNPNTWIQERILRAKQKQGSIRQSLNAAYNSLPESEKLFLYILFLNSLVLVAWKVPSMQAFMTRYFCSSTTAKAVCWPMFLSTFSHYSVLHFAANMSVLYSFSSGIVSSLGREQFVAFYLCAGVISSFTSLCCKMMTKQVAVSLGASGAIMAIISYICTKHPDSLLQIMFLPYFTFKAGTAIKAIIALDLTGVILNWKFFDHAAHLGGAAFGIFWYYYGNYYIWRNRGPIVEWWHSIRTNSTDN